MGIHTDIQWCDSTVNPTENCDGCELWIPSQGRKSCYAGRMTERFRGHGAFDQPIALKPGRVSAAAEWSDLRGKARSDKPWIGELPRLIFLSDMSDALSKAVPFAYLDFEIIKQVSSILGSRHIWIWLTKRPQRMAEFSRWIEGHGTTWPANLWAVTSVTDQKTAAARIPWLLQVGNEDTVRGISAEPIWGDIDLGKIEPLESRFLDWIIVGGESGRNTSNGTFERISQMVDQADDLDVPCFVKQMGKDPAWRDPKGGDWSEWPATLLTRQFPYL